MRFLITKCIIGRTIMKFIAICYVYTTTAEIF